eukprot:883514-Pelagomonas_calceolata.AAC.3
MFWCPGALRTGSLLPAVFYQLASGMSRASERVPDSNFANPSNGGEHNSWGDGAQRAIQGEVLNTMMVVIDGMAGQEAR